MKVIISPAKRFKHFNNYKTEELIYPEKTKKLVDDIKTLSMNQIGNLNKTNDQLTEKAYYDYQDFDFDKLDNPAIFSYNGLVFNQFSEKDFDDYAYLNEHVYIISALYGPLKPFTGIRDYRLYFDNDRYDLYDFWGSDIYKEIFKDKEVVINLASKEYSETIRKYLKEDDVFIDVDFKDEKDGKVRSIVAWTKQMRGKMLKKIIKDKISEPEKIKDITIDSYIFDPILSTKTNYVFVRRNS